MKRILLSLLLSSQLLLAQENSPVDAVNPLMGSMSSMELSNGNTYPTVCLPFGMNNWAPHTGKMGDGFLYTYQTNYLYGFKQTHQASLWINDYGQFSLMPVTKKNQFTEKGRRSWFSHKMEVAKPYYYSVYLADHHAKVEIAPTERAAKFKIGFHEADSAFITIDAYDKGSYIKIIPSENKIVGYSTRNSGGVPENFKNYFVLTFDKPFLSHDVWKDTILVKNVLDLKADHVGAIVGFKLKKGESVNVNVATSYISEAQALLNLKEIGTDSFEQVKEKARNTWNKELGRVKIDGATQDQRATFYSCLYRMLIFPRKFYEINAKGEIMHYSPYNGKVLPGYMYADNGFWDTFRAQFPFLNLMFPSRVTEIIKGLENTYKESGWLPEWFSPGHRDCMIGSHSASVITDAYLKGVKGMDINLLYEAIQKNTKGVGPVSSVGRLGAEAYNELGYVPYDIEVNQNASRTLEYAYNDFCIYQLAKALKKPDDEVALFYNRSFNYKNLFDRSTGLMRPKGKDGTFLKTFDPFRWGEHFTEGNSWQYTWFVPHDVKGLEKLMGGKDQFFMKMDSVFTLPSIYDISYYKRGIIHLIREMQGVDMGQYAHLNEPMHHMVYMYNFGKPWKTQYWVRTILDRLYQPTPDGFPGDEDNGQMSAWYVMSSLGFYPLAPGTTQYVTGAPLFKKVELVFENNNKLVINAPENSKTNFYVNNVTFNNKPYTKSFYEHFDLLKGGTINIKMSAKPNLLRGTNPTDFPYALSK